MGSPKRMTMPPKPKLRTVRSTAKDEIAALKDRLAKAEDDAAHWKQEAVDAEKQIQAAVKLLGLSAYAELVESVKSLDRKSVV